MSRLRHFVLLASAVLLAGQQQDPLIGRWRSVEISSAGVSAVFEFHPDHEMDSYSAVLTDGRFRLVGTDTVLLQSKEGHEEKQELEWDAEDRARIEDEAAGKSIELSRAGKTLDRKNPLYGEWRTTLPWNGENYPASVVFSADGTVRWMTTLRKEQGHYSVTGGSIRFEVSGRPVVTGSFAVQKDRLTLPNPKGGESAFEKF